MMEYWDVTNITDLSYLFATDRNKDMVTFQIDISHLDVQNASNMEGMFYGATTFNCNLSLWDGNQVQYFTYMFYEAKSFIGIGLEHWLINPLLVNDTSYMFTDATFFNGNSSSWDVSGVQTMIETFANAQTFSGIE